MVIADYGWVGYPAVPDLGGRRRITPAGYPRSDKILSEYPAKSGKACRIIAPDIRHPVRKTRSGPCRPINDLPRYSFPTSGLIRGACGIPLCDGLEAEAEIFEL